MKGRSPRSVESFDVDSQLKKALQHYRNGQFKEAENIYRRVAKSHPTHNCYANLGAALQAQGLFSDAIRFYEKSLELKPDYAEAYFSLGSTFHAQAQLEKALSCYEKAVEFNPNYAEVYHNMGILFQEQDKLDEAITCYQRAIELKPDFPVALNAMGTALKYKGKLDEAISCFEKALQLRQDYPEPLVNLLDQLEQTCSWNKLSTTSVKLDVLTKNALDKGFKPAETPFHSLSRHMDSKRQFVIAKLLSADIAARVSKLRTGFTFYDRTSVSNRITVGYLSNDFNDHPMAHLTLGLFAMHNRDDFRVFCYSYGLDDGSHYRKRIEQDSDRFIDVRNLSHADTARCIYEDKVDILVELKGYTKGSRLEICAFRPAPIQVRYLGLAGTTGAEFFDYIITDKIVTPEDDACFYTEQFVYLPHCYQINDNTQTISKKSWRRSDVGLPETGFVFCSFNQGYKIDPIMFDGWMNILREIPEGVLWLQPGNKAAKKNLKQEAENRGIKSDRIIFAEPLPKEEHLARLRLADLALDTRIVNGAATTSDALWVGVPVITLQGRHFASRMSSSILTAIGATHMVTHNMQEYQSLAVDLARDPARMDAIRRKIAKNRWTKPLFDTRRFVGNLEKAYRKMWQIYLLGERPEMIKVVEN